MSSSSCPWPREAGVGNAVGIADSASHTWPPPLAGDRSTIPQPRRVTTQTAAGLMGPTWRSSSVTKGPQHQTFPLAMAEWSQGLCVCLFLVNVDARWVTASLSRAGPVLHPQSCISRAASLVLHLQSCISSQGQPSDNIGHVPA